MLKKFLRERARSFAYAFAGIKTLFQTQPNIWLHSLATIAVLGLGFFLPLARWEWASLVFAIGLVWIAEAFNSALEFLCDAAMPEEHPLIKKSKDIAAAAVLFAAFTSVFLGLIILGPHLLRIFYPR